MKNAVTANASLCMGERFEAEAARAPRACAVAHHDRSLTYAELNDAADALARRLCAAGVGPGASVAILLRRSIELVIAELAIIKCRAAYVPLDPASPAQRLAFMVADCGAAVIVSRRDEVVPGAIRARRVDVDVVSRGDSADAHVELGPPAHGEMPAYVMYTSGSTGRPKGVIATHRGVVTLASANDAFGARPGDRVAFGANPAFDASTFELWGALLNGACVVIVDHETMIDPARLAATLANERITVLFITTALFNQCALQRPDAFAHLRNILSGGERADVRAWNRMRECESAARLIHAYGPTETTTFATTWTLEHRGTILENVPIGRAVGGAHAFIADAKGDMVAAGTAGELYVGGMGVAMGYLGRPGLTAERFVPDPFARTPGARCYRTGDFVMQSADGDLHFLERTDDQIKLRGHRIELGEIEAALQAHPAVSQATVVAHAGRGEIDGSAGFELIAYVVPRDAVGATGSVDANHAANACDARALRASLREQLPDYMVPATFTILDRLPLNANGKVDRGSLPVPVRHTPPFDESYCAPETPLERALAEIWAGVLGLEQVSVDHSLVDLGGHSLVAVQVMTRARERCGIDVPLHALLSGATIREIAALCDDNGRPAAALLPTLVPPGRRPAEIPASFAQEAAALFAEIAPDTAMYQFQGTVRIAGPLDVPALERALALMIDRHEILRTTFHSRAHGLVQEIHAPWAVRLEAIDLSHEDAATREDVLQRRLAEEFRAPFHVDRLPLVRWPLFRLTEDCHVLAQIEHHFVHDGWSFALFMRELWTRYADEHVGRTTQDAAPSIQYSDFALWQREWVRTPEAEAEVAYWKKQLAGVPPSLELPTDRPRSANMSFRGASMRVTLSRDLAAAVEECRRANGVTLFVTLMAAFQSLISRYAGQEDFCIGTAVANRHARALEGVIGMIVNTVAVRSNVTGNPTVRELLQRVQRSTAAAFANETVPFSFVVDAVQPERASNVLPVYQVAFSFHDSPMPPTRIGDLRLTFTEGLSNGATKLDLSVVVIPRLADDAPSPAHRDITLIWDYSTDLFDASSIERLARAYATVLAEMVASGDARVGELALLSVAERHQLVAAWNETTRLYAAEACVHELFEQHAARTPAAIAVMQDGRTVSYATVNARATELARALVAAGVAPEQRVAVCLDRAVELVVVVLAIWKAGGVYVPLDPAYPEPRLRWMLEDSRPVAVLTTPVVAARAGVAALVASIGVAVHDIGSLTADGAWSEQAWGAGPATFTAPQRVTPENAAYVIYTSGSTGTPKGVVVPHAGVCNLSEAQRVGLAVTAASRVLQFASVSFDAHVWELVQALTHGAALVLPAPGAALTDELVRLVRAPGALTHVTLPPAVATLLDDAAVAGLETIVLAGEAVPAGLVPRWPSPRRVINAYGPTEATVCATYGECDRAAIDAPSIGGPIANMRTYVLDEHGGPVPIGVTGELFVGGRGVARGYLNRPGLTAERFVPDAFGREGNRLYRTGDLARWRPDGTLEFIGRADHQIKLHGHRIELGEIEAALTAHPRVSQAVVIVREDQPGDRSLVAYFVGADVAAEQLRSYLAKQLPGHMVPSAFVALAALPLASSGKVDRKQLPGLPTAVSMARGYEAPRGATEEALAKLWAAELGVARVGRNDRFFDVGGHSLLGMQVVLRMRQELGMVVGLSDLFRWPRLADFARAAAEETELVESVLAQVEGSSGTDALTRSRDAASSNGELGEAVR